jgi:allophanate hydrolase
MAGHKSDMTWTPSSGSLDATTLRTQYASGAITPRDVVNAVYDRIAARGDDHVWIHLLPRVEALARAADLERNGRSLSLFGIPFAVKDNIDVAGMPTTAGCPAFAYVPAVTATAVRKLLESGAILIGKTNLDQFATGLVGVRSPYGICANVFDSRYVPGGSSSGSAVAVAAGLVTFALGTDTAGSGRVPAAFNNIVGLKPTRGVVSAAGVVPACQSLDCVSIFALTCEDARTALAALAGFDRADPYSRNEAPDLNSAASWKGIRAGIPKDEDLEFFGDSEARALFESAVARLKSLGATPVEIDFTAFRETAQLLYQGPWVAERLSFLRDFLGGHAADVHPVTRTIISGADKLSAVDVFNGLHRLEELKKKAALEWARMDVLLVPTTPSIYTIEEVEANPYQLNTNLGYYTNFVNLLDESAIALPAGFRSNGLPFGVSVIAPALRDGMLCSLGAEYRAAPTLRLAVVGAHLTGEPLNYQLIDCGATLAKTCRTAPIYRLYALQAAVPAKPGLVRTLDNSGAAIEIEVWDIPVARFGSFVAKVPPPLTIGTIVTEYGEQVKGFLCESYAVEGKPLISAYGGWRAYLRANSSAAATRNTI